MPIRHGLRSKIANKYTDPTHNSAVVEFASSKTSKLIGDITPRGAFIPGKRTTISEEAERLGLPIPEDAKDALKIKHIVMAEERQRKMRLDQEVMMRVRVPVIAVNQLSFILVGTITKELTTVRAIFEDMSDIPEEMKKVLRERSREWIEKILTTLSEIQVDELRLIPPNVSIKDIIDASESGSLGNSYPGSSGPVVDQNGSPVIPQDPNDSGGGEGAMVQGEPVLGEGSLEDLADKSEETEAQEVTELY